jgi:hypothetical protein
MTIAANPEVKFAQHELTADTLADMRAIFGTMTAETCGVLAQIVPVLMLTLLFEIRARKRRPVRAGVVIAGFFGNLLVASLALILEFVLLAGLNAGGFKEAFVVWFMVGLLFGIVVLRWVFTSSGFEIINREMAPEKSIARAQKFATLLVNFTDAYLNAIASAIEGLFRATTWLVEHIAELPVWLAETVTGDRRRRRRAEDEMEPK